MTVTPPDCIKKFDIEILSLQSNSLNPEQIEDIIRLDSIENIIEIGTNDFETYANKEATVQLRVVSEA